VEREPLIRMPPALPLAFASHAQRNRRQLQCERVVHTHPPIPIPLHKT